jgi:hypothetical protein
VPSGILTAMSFCRWTPVGARPNWAAATNHRNETNNTAPEYNPAAFTTGHGATRPIPPMALVDGLATDIGMSDVTCCVGQVRANVDSPFARFSLTESKELQFRADFFKLLNHANRDDPISDISTGDFGKILSFSSSPRIIRYH